MGRFATPKPVAMDADFLAKAACLYLVGLLRFDAPRALLRVLLDLIETLRFGSSTIVVLLGEKQTFPLFAGFDLVLVLPTACFFRFPLLVMSYSENCLNESARECGVMFFIMWADYIRACSMADLMKSSCPSAVYSID